jgi:heme-degrading monooxygenase HmoA
LEILYRSGKLVGRGDLARYAVAAVYGHRSRIPDEAARDPSVATYLVGNYSLGARGFTEEAETAHARGQLAWEVYCRSSAGRSLVALGEFAEAATEIARSAALVDRLPGLGLGWQLLHHQGAEDARTMALDTRWPQRLAAFAPWMKPGPERHWGRAAIAAIGARIHARMGDTQLALRLLSAPVHALQRAPAWAPNYRRTACEIAETLWLLNRRDHLSVVESALRDKALPADFRFPMTDARLALARLCALDARHEEAHQWFVEARDVLDHQGARPLRAVVDHDEALMHLRAGSRGAADPFAEAAGAAFERLGMTGWARRLEGATG